MKISTKSLASLLLITALALPAADRHRKRGVPSRYDRVLQRHDKKGELRSAVLGISLVEFKRLEKQRSFEEALHARGFYTIRQYRQALLGKIRHELRQRGWTAKRIEAYSTPQAASKRHM